MTKKNEDSYLFNFLFVQESVNSTLIKNFFQAVVAVVIVTAVMEEAETAAGVVADSEAGMADATVGMAVGVTATEAVTEVAMVAEGNFEFSLKF